VVAFDARCRLGKIGFVLHFFHLLVKSVSYDEGLEAAYPQPTKDFNARVATDAIDANGEADKRDGGHQKSKSSIESKKDIKS